jgi:hypothetical protein
MEDRVTDLKHWLGVLDKVAEQAKDTDPERARAISKAEDILIRRYLLSKESHASTSPSG